MKKVFLPVIFFLSTPLALVFCLSLLFSLYSGTHGLASVDNRPRVAYAAIPAASGTLKINIYAQDARRTAVASFFKRYNSDLLPYAQDVVNAADKYGLDYRLIPAIAMQESNLCKKAPKDSYNCWGFGIYGGKITKFENYTQAIDTVTKTLASQYKAKGLATPEEIMSKYTPSSNGSWAASVNMFMDQLSVSL